MKADSLKESIRTKTQEALCSWKNVNNLAATTFAKLYAAVCKSEQGVVFANANVFARVHFGATLSNKNRACGDLGAVKYLDTKSLRV
jgi:hypothetical protein